MNATTFTRELEELRANKNEAFQALMKLIAPANQDEAIVQFVKATHNAWTIGWQEGYRSGSDIVTCQGCDTDISREYNHYC